MSGSKDVHFHNSSKHVHFHNSKDKFIQIDMKTCIHTIKYLWSLQRNQDNFSIVCLLYGQFTHHRKQSQLRK